MDFDGNAVTPDMIFDGGDLDCGSGLILLIRENMLKTPVDGILEMRSREPTVADDLRPGAGWPPRVPGQGRWRRLQPLFHQKGQWCQRG